MIGRAVVPFRRAVVFTASTPPSGVRNGIARHEPLRGSCPVLEPVLVRDLDDDQVVCILLVIVALDVIRVVALCHESAGLGLWAGLANKVNVAAVSFSGYVLLKIRDSGSLPPREPRVSKPGPGSDKGT